MSFAFVVLVAIVVLTVNAGLLLIHMRLHDAEQRLADERWRRRFEP